MFSYQAEVKRLRSENAAMREGGAVGGVGNSTCNTNNTLLAKDLRMAAATAESNLRYYYCEKLFLIGPLIESSSFHTDNF